MTTAPDSEAGTRSSDGLPRVATDRGTWAQILADVSVVTVTPFLDDGPRSVDHAGLERNLEHLLRGGIRLLVAGGNTGEFAALSEAEIVDTVRTHTRVASGHARVIAGVGYRLETAIELGRACIEAGADAIMVHHPIHPYTSEAGLVAYYGGLADALPGIPLILYVRGPQLTAHGVRELVRIDSIVGVKVGLPDPERFALFVDAAPGFAWVCGVAEAWAVPFWAAGAIGFTSGLANVAPERSLEVLAALQAHDVARAISLVDRLRPLEVLRSTRQDANNVAVIKAAMDIAGLAGGPLRPPLSALEPGDHAELTRILGELEVHP